MGCYMIWRLYFKDEEAKKYFEKKCKYAKLIHNHYEKELDLKYNFKYKHNDFYYDAGYCGYAEAEGMIKDLKKHGIVKFEELTLCDTSAFKKVREL